MCTCGNNVQVYVFSVYLCVYAYQRFQNPACSLLSCDTGLLSRLSNPIRPFTAAEVKVVCAYQLSPICAPLHIVVASL
jgi:hypothetical protein